MKLISKHIIGIIFLDRLLPALLFDVLFESEGKGSTAVLFFTTAVNYYLIELQIRFYPVAVVL
jgi:hypothetical protein